MEATPGKPQRFIYNESDMAAFLNSPARAELLRLIAAMGKACADPGFHYDPSRPLAGLTPALASLHGSLTVMVEKWVQDIPPVDSQATMIRFGNPSFKEWHARLVERSGAIVKSILVLNSQYPGSGSAEGEDFDYAILEAAHNKGKQAASSPSPSSLDETEVAQAVVQEIKAYLEDSFGHPIRLDYGTGHESSFQVLLFALCKLHCFGSTPESPPSKRMLKAATLSLYHQYLQVTRKLQTVYRLEPAGSHGVWGLDDYYCLSFYFGACQLQGVVDHEYEPSSINDTSILEEKHNEYLYFGCIRFIKQLKQGVPFFETSPMLSDIANLPTWSKVASGLLKLYEGEVLKKRPVVQHFRFGTLFAANWIASPPPKEPPRDSIFTVPSANSSGAPAAFEGTRAPWAK